VIAFAAYDIRAWVSIAAFWQIVGYWIFDPADIDLSVGWTILNRFIDLKLDFPKLKKGAFSFRAYFTLKTTLSIQSALSRLHEPNTTKDIQQVLQKLKPDLKAIQEAEKTLCQSQQAALDEITRPIAIAS